MWKMMGIGKKGEKVVGRGGNELFEANNIYKTISNVHVRYFILYSNEISLWQV